MSVKKTAIPALAFAALIGAVPLHHAAAQASPQSHAEMHHGMGEHVMPGRHIEGRIAFLRAELKITDAQAPQFDKLASVMRENAKEMDQVIGQMQANRDQPLSAVQRLEARAHFTEARATQRFLAAFKPLYDSLSDEQKKSADELLTPRHHRG